MKKVYFILMFCMLPKFVLANACDGVDFNPELSLYSSYGELKYDLDKDVGYISRLAESIGFEETFVAGGLASAEVVMSVGFDGFFQYKDINDICVVPKNVEVFIGFQNPTIYVANHYQPDTCEYYVTVRHEQAHMQINKKALEYFLPFLKEEIIKIINSVKPLNIGNINDVKQANDYINNQYYTQIKDLVTRFNEILATEHKKLDNKSNYEYERSLCK